MRYKALVLTVGTIYEGEQKGWLFDNRGHVVAFEIDEQGEIYWSGYTLSELQEIMERSKNNIVELSI